MRVATNAPRSLDPDRRAGRRTAPVERGAGRVEHTPEQLVRGDDGEALRPDPDPVSPADPGNVAEQEGAGSLRAEGHNLAEAVAGGAGDADHVTHAHRQAPDLDLVADHAGDAAVRTVARHRGERRE